MILCDILGGKNKTTETDQWLPEMSVEERTKNRREKSFWDGENISLLDCNVCQNSSNCTHKNHEFYFILFI